MNADTNIKVTNSDGKKYTVLDYTNLYSFNTVKILKNKKSFKKENEDKSIIPKDLTIEQTLSGI